MQYDELKPLVVIATQTLTCLHALQLFVPKTYREAQLQTAVLLSVSDIQNAHYQTLITYMRKKFTTNQDRGRKVNQNQADNKNV